MFGRKFSLLFFLMALFIASPVKAEVYKWTDEYGNVHYGDKPLSGKDISPMDIQSAKPAAPSAGLLSTPGFDAGGVNNAQVKSSTKKRRQAVSDLYKKLDQRNRKTNQENNEIFRKREEERVRRNIATRKFSESNRALEAERTREKFAVARETKKRLDNTLTFCQRNPQHYKCSNNFEQYKDGNVYRSRHVTVPGTNQMLSKKQLEEQRAIKAEQKKKTDRINRQYSKKSKKEFDRIYNGKK